MLEKQAAPKLIGMAAAGVTGYGASKLLRYMSGEEEDNNENEIEKTSSLKSILRRAKILARRKMFQLRILDPKIKFPIAIGGGIAIGKGIKYGLGFYDSPKIDTSILGQLKTKMTENPLMAAALGVGGAGLLGFGTERLLGDNEEEE